jgi:hypothetical protein
MKGTIPKCLSELVELNFGKAKWQSALEMVGLPKNKIFWPGEDIEDAKVMQLVTAVCKLNNLTPIQAAEAFGEFWVNDYAPRAYPLYFKGTTSARDFLLKMDSVHITMTQNIPNAHPPRFGYEWADKKTLVITYKSNRNLIDFLVGLIKGVGSHFKENLSVVKMSQTQVKVTFQ